MPNRRNVLIGLGGLVAGGGALIGTGAFDTVEAQRDVNVETAGDADAFLGLSAARDDFDDVDGENFVIEEDDTIVVNLDGDSPGEGDGLNRNARTTFRNLVTVSNNGTQDVDQLSLSFNDEDLSINVDQTFEFPVDETDGDGAHEYGNGDNLLDGEVIDTLGPGDTINFGLTVDLIDGGDEDNDLPDEDYTLTIEADAAE